MDIQRQYTAAGDPVVEKLYKDFDFRVVPLPYTEVLDVAAVRHDLERDRDRAGPTARVVRSADVGEPDTDVDDSVELWDFENTGPSFGPIETLLRSDRFSRSIRSRAISSINSRFETHRRDRSGLRL